MAVTIAAFACLFCFVLVWTVVDMRIALNREWDRVDQLEKQLGCALSSYPEQRDKILNVD